MPVSKVDTKMNVSRISVRIVCQKKHKSREGCETGVSYKFYLQTQGLMGENKNLVLGQQSS